MRRKTPSSRRTAHTSQRKACVGHPRLSHQPVPFLRSLGLLGLEIFLGLSRVLLKNRISRGLEFRKCSQFLRHVGRAHSLAKPRYFVEDDFPGFKRNDPTRVLLTAKIRTIGIKVVGLNPTIADPFFKRDEEKKVLLALQKVFPQLTIYPLRFISGQKDVNGLRDLRYRRWSSSKIGLATNHLLLLQSPQAFHGAPR